MQQNFVTDTSRITGATGYANEMKWNESGFRPPLCTYRLNWARRTSWGWWDDWDDTVLQTQDSKFEPWRSEAEHATSRSRMFPTILTFTRGWGRNIFVSFKPPGPGTEPRTMHPTNTMKIVGAVSFSMMGQRLRRLPNIETALVECLVKCLLGPSKKKDIPHELLVALFT